MRRHVKTKFITVLVGLVALAAALAGHPNKLGRAPERIELHDQFGTPQRLNFPGTNIVVLVVADRKGSEQVQGWVSTLGSRYSRRINVRGLADVSSVPGLLRDSVRRSIRQTFAHPVMLDWTGELASALGRQQNEAFVLVITRSGEVVARVNGSARDENVKKGLRCH